MSGSTYGKLFRVTTWGESHGPATGVVIDGCPAGLFLSPEIIQTYLTRRQPRPETYATTRQERDQVQILSGIYENRTLGTPLSLLIPNTDCHPEEYRHLQQLYRPGHADFTYRQKYGWGSVPGGGRASGRETVGRVAAGAVAVAILRELSISLCTYTKAIGEVTVADQDYRQGDISQNPLFMPNNDCAKEALKFLEKAARQKDSLGGIIECRGKGLPVGLGEPVFDKLEATIAKGVLSIGGIKGIAFGDGFLAAKQTGSTHNDGFHLAGQRIQKTTNHSGGVLGGISDGGDLLFRVAVKPTPSIGRPQSTVTYDGQPARLAINGRHDTCIVPRAVVVVESMTAITLVDFLLQHMHSQLSFVQDFYKTTSATDL